MMSSQYSLLAIVVVAVIAGVSEALPPKRIVGGHDAVTGEFPYQVSLDVDDQYECGGAIISSRHVLTAGHCVETVDVSTFAGFVVTTGSVLPNTGQNHIVESIAIHPKYQSVGYVSIYDIAIITLKENIIFDANQNKVELPTGYTSGGVAAIVTGFGRNSAVLRLFPDRLQKATVTTLNYTECRPGLEFFMDKNITCTTAPRGTGICRGDSGGPLVSGGTLIGIASFTGFCGIGDPDVYTAVYYHMDWIQQILSST